MKRIITLCMLAALTVQGATLTAKDGKTVEADVVSFSDGVFTIRSNGRIISYPAADLAKIEFEKAVKKKKAKAIKMDIVKVSTILSRWDRNDWREWTNRSYSFYGGGEKSDDYYLKPSVRIDCRVIGNTFGQRPVVVLRLNIQEPKSGSVDQMVLWYDWKNDYGWREGGDPKSESKKQPQCALAHLSPETLYKGSVERYQPIRFEHRVKILATRAEIWVGGNMIASKTEKKDWGSSLPIAWRN